MTEQRERLIAQATVTLNNDPKFGGTRDEVVTVTDYPDAEVVAIEVEHYDGARVIELGYPAWRALRATIAAEGRVSARAPRKEVTP